MGNDPTISDAWVSVNQAVLQSALHHCNKVTLDIDATEVVSNKTSAEWTYKNNKGFMPMVGHIAQTGQIVAVDFRQGNVPPNKDNLAFIKQCHTNLCSISIKYWPKKSGVILMGLHANKRISTDDLSRIEHLISA